MPRAQGQNNIFFIVQEPQKGMGIATFNQGDLLFDDFETAFAAAKLKKKNINKLAILTIQWDPEQIKKLEPIEGGYLYRGPAINVPTMGGNMVSEYIKEYKTREETPRGLHGRFFNPSASEGQIQPQQKDIPSSADNRAYEEFKREMDIIEKTCDDKARVIVAAIENRNNPNSKNKDNTLRLYIHNDINMGLNLAAEYIRAHLYADLNSALPFMKPILEYLQTLPSGSSLLVNLDEEKTGIIKEDNHFIMRFSPLDLELLVTERLDEIKNQKMAELQQKFSESSHHVKLK